MTTRKRRTPKVTPQELVVGPLSFHISRVSGNRPLLPGAYQVRNSKNNHPRQRGGVVDVRHNPDRFRLPERRLAEAS